MPTPDKLLVQYAGWSDTNPRMVACHHCEPLRTIIEATTLSIPNQSTPRVKRWAHRIAIIAVVLWWCYAFLSTGGFTSISALGLLVYLLGLPVCYVLSNAAVRGAIWVFWSLYSDDEHQC